MVVFTLGEKSINQSIRTVFGTNVQSWDGFCFVLNFIDALIIKLNPVKRKKMLQYSEVSNKDGVFLLSLQG